MEHLMKVALLNLLKCKKDSDVDGFHAIKINMGGKM
jgi:hypothetical protein